MRRRRSGRKTWSFGLLLGSKRPRFDEQTYPEPARVAVTEGTPQICDQWRPSARVPSPFSCGECLLTGVFLPVGPPVSSGDILLPR